MILREIVHTCSNAHIARAALASIGGEFAASFRGLGVAQQYVGGRARCAYGQGILDRRPPTRNGTASTRRCAAPTSRSCRGCAIFFRMVCAPRTNPSDDPKTNGAAPWIHRAAPAQSLLRLNLRTRLAVLADLGDILSRGATAAREDYLRCRRRSHCRCDCLVALAPSRSSRRPRGSTKFSRAACCASARRGITGPSPRSTRRAAPIPASTSISRNRSARRSASRSNSRRRAGPISPRISTPARFDIAMGGVSVTLDRAKKGFFSTPYYARGQDADRALRRQGQISDACARSTGPASR